MQNISAMTQLVCFSLHRNDLHLSVYGVMGNVPDQESGEDPRCGFTMDYVLILGKTLNTFIFIFHSLKSKAENIILKGLF
jgi:hypothetical protein